MSKIKFKLLSHDFIDNGKLYSTFNEKGEFNIHEAEDGILIKLNSTNPKYEIVSGEEKREIKSK